MDVLKYSQEFDSLDFACCGPGIWHRIWHQLSSAQ